MTAESGVDMPARILLLEDSEIDADLLIEQLDRGAPAFTMKRVVTEAEFSAALNSGDIDLILSDYSLPGFDGRQALEIAHARVPDVPFIFVSGVLGEEVAIESLQRGATDYMLKHRLSRLPAAVDRAVTEMRERRDRRQAQQRLEAIGQLTSGLAHDFNKLLTVVLGNLKFVEEACPDAAVARHLAHMRSAAERGASLTEQLLAFSRRQKLEPKSTDLADRVAAMRELLQSTMGGGIRVRTSIEPGLWPALVDPNQIELVILNLAINARDAMPDGGDLTVETANVHLDDTGTGMTPEVLARAIEPFFTTKEIGKGSGLGLAQVYGFAKQSGGTIRIDSREGHGTSVRVFLPRATTPAAAAAKPAAAPPARTDTRPPTILLVDDDSDVRWITAELLSDLGYTILQAASGEAALDILQAGQAIDLMLMDLAMPGMNGMELSRQALEQRPGLPMLFVTGYADPAAVAALGEDRIIRKPYRNQELAAKLQHMLVRR
jgi:signal transduction histidine kinase